MQRFGEKLRTLRVKKGMTLRELSSTLGYASHAYINSVEMGKKNPTVELVMKVAQIFNVTPDQLLQDDLEIPD
jgi:transcriptional regulator with XRE-family HTH domain